MTIDFRFYLSLFLRRLPYFLIMLALGSAIGLTLAAVLPPVYRAKAVLIVESQQIPSDLAETTVQTEAREQLQIIQQRILTRDRLIDMARDLGVYAARGDIPAQQLPGDELVRDMRRRISIETTGGSGGRGPAEATIVRISFEAPTGQMSAVVTNEIVTQLLEENVRIRTGVARQTLQFFTDEVARLDQELSRRGAEILAFQEQNLEDLPDSLEFRRRQQAAAQERLQQLDREVATLTDRRSNLVALYEATGQIGSATPVANLTPDERELQTLNGELSRALAILSPQNPRVLVLQAQVAAQEQTIASRSQNASVVDEAGQVLSAYEIQLADVDSQINFIVAQQDQIRATMEKLRLSIEATPSNANTFDTLQRDYQAVRIQYDQAIANRARAETGDTLEALAKGQRISVIEQALSPNKPESPNRPVLAAAGVGTGFMLGLALVVLIEFLGSAIRRPIDITRSLGITPLGTIPMMRSPWDIVRRRAIIAAGFVIVLVGLPSVLWLVHTQITPLDTLIDGILRRVGLA